MLKKSASFVLGHFPLQDVQIFEALLWQNGVAQLTSDLTMVHRQSTDLLFAC